jgi:hypothetical protein
LKFAECWGKYVMTDALSPNLLELFDDLLDTIKFITRRDFDQFDERMAKLRVVELLCKFEVSVPAIEHAIVFHELLHLVVDIDRWGSGITVQCSLTRRSHTNTSHYRWDDTLLSEPWPLLCPTRTTSSARSSVVANFWMFSFER